MTWGRREIEERGREEKRGRGNSVRERKVRKNKMKLMEKRDDNKPRKTRNKRKTRAVKMKK